MLSITKKIEDIYINFCTLYYLVFVLRKYYTTILVYSKSRKS